MESILYEPPCQVGGPNDDVMWQSRIFSNLEMIPRVTEDNKGVKGSLYEHEVSIQSFTLYWMILILFLGSSSI
jgi:hypothetical protein